MKKFLLSFVILILLISYNSFSQVDTTAKIEELKPYVTRFFNLFKKNDFENIYKMLDTASMMGLPKDQLKMMWKMPITRLGNMIDILSLEYSNEPFQNSNYDIINISYDLELAIVGFKFTFTEDHKIKEFLISSIKEKELYTVPDYVDTNSFTENDLSFGADSWRLPGVLSIPNGDGPFPLIILVHDSGPNDKDETIASNKPFRDLAWGFASNGIAAFRYDNRKKVNYDDFINKIKNYTINDEVINDVFAAVDTLKLFKSINPRRIFLLGYGYGGYVLPRIAEASENIYGLIFLAATVRNPEDVILDKYIYLFSRDKESTKGKGVFLDSLRASVERVKDTTLTFGTNTSLLPENIPASYWLDLRGYNPAMIALNLKRPMLFLQGKRDFSVTTEDFNLWKKELTSRKDIHFKLYPKLNHLFIEGKGKSSPEEEFAPGNIPWYVIKEIMDWLMKLK